jgi:hypothetical protein
MTANILLAPRSRTRREPTSHHQRSNVHIPQSANDQYTTRCDVTNPRSYSARTDELTAGPIRSAGEVPISEQCATWCCAHQRFLERRYTLEGIFYRRSNLQMPRYMALGQKGRWQMGSRSGRTGLVEPGCEERRGNRGAKMLVRHLLPVDAASGLTAMGCRDTAAGFDLRRYGRNVTI